MRGPEEESRQAAPDPEEALEAGREVQARVPRAQEDLPDPSPEVPNPAEAEACRGPSPRGGAATPPPGDVSGRLGEASSRRGVDASTGRGDGPSPPEEAASRRGEAPSPAAEVL